LKAQRRRLHPAGEDHISAPPLAMPPSMVITVPVV
jgi:hypothetical protein